jgi:DedD protein
MAFFKFRKSGDESSAAPAQPESVEGMRKRAKFRLIGAAVLVLIGVIGFPMLFDKQPRPIAVDTPIDIPDKNKARPLSIPAPAAVDATKPEVVAPVAPAAPGKAEVAAPIIEEKAPEAPTAAVQIVPKAAAVAEPKPVVKPVEKPAPVVKPMPKAEDAAKAQALLDGKSPEKNTDAPVGRFVVQVGAFADAPRAREVRLKVEHAGLKTYTHVAQTIDGSRIRVRVGPFGTRAEADKAAEKIKKLGLPAAILTL